VIVNDAADLFDFVTDVFGVEESVEARGPMPDGRLIHSQVRLGSVDLMIADRLDEPTAFYGEVTLGRMLDSWQNIWWLHAPTPGQPDPKPTWDGGSDVIFATLDRTLRRT
jgi:hypothetical protein